LVAVNNILFWGIQHLLKYVQTHWKIQFAPFLPQTLTLFHNFLYFPQEPSTSDFSEPKLGKKCFEFDLMNFKLQLYTLSVVDLQLVGIFRKVIRI